MLNKRILVVTSCTGEKLHKPENQLTIEDFQNIDRLNRRENELDNYKTTAADMYTGKQHLALMDGINSYRSAGGEIDLAILSAGYGMLREGDMIAPYEVTFNQMNSAKIHSWSNQIKVTECLQNYIANYDLIFFLLGDKYLQAIDLPLKIKDSQKLIFFAGQSSSSKILWDNGEYMMGIGVKEAKKFRSGLIEIKGYLFAQLLKFICLNGVGIWDELYNKPQLVSDYIIEYNHSVRQLELFNDEIVTSKYLAFTKELYPVPNHLLSKNYGSELNYYLPENDDRVDPNYSFFEDKSDKQRDTLEDNYAHELLHTPQYDGILISKVNIDGATKRKQSVIEEKGIRSVLRLHENYPIMGDCGAFSYIGDEFPPYSTEEVLNYYESLGFNYGVSVDHLIVGPYEKDSTERLRRYNITLKNAKEFIQKHKEGNFNFKPIGVVQGWDPDSFRNAISKLINMGYEYVALGGLAFEKSEKIYEILKAISPIIPNERFKMHLFGVAREMRVMKAFHKLGVTSFDSAGPLRKAWLGATNNYHLSNSNHYAVSKFYAAIRIPEAHETKGRVKKVIQEKCVDIALIKDMEKKALESLRLYNDGELDIDSTLNAIMDYDEFVGDKKKRKIYEDHYRKVLIDRPWEKCNCKICKTVGIEVIIFRGNNRNRRRGFHNTHVYFVQIKKLKEELEKERIV